MTTKDIMEQLVEGTTHDDKINAVFERAIACVDGIEGLTHGDVINGLFKAAAFELARLPHADSVRMIAVCAVWFERMQEVARAYEAAKEKTA